MSRDLSTAAWTKFELLSNGISIAPRAQRYIDERNHGRPMTPADYASTSGVILVLEDNVWVNAPIAVHNANFVEHPNLVLDLDGDALCVRGGEVLISARFWIPPAYHGACNADDEPYNMYAFTHADRVRISPIEGCSMTCKFCDLPYEFKYRTKSLERLVESVAVATGDPVQPAHHVLISGGTPRDSDIGYVRDCYEAVITGFPDTPVDVMMVPIDDLMDPEWLNRIGVHEISVNIEIYNLDLARRIMRRKHDQGRDHYLDYLERAASVLGDHRVRSMLMVGLEPMEDTLAAVRAIAERGAVPVLSPFRPDPSTPLRNDPPPTAEFMMETYRRSQEIVAGLDMPLGPRCIPCSHNTLTLASDGGGDAHVSYGEPYVV